MVEYYKAVFGWFACPLNGMQIAMLNCDVFSKRWRKF